MKPKFLIISLFSFLFFITNSSFQQTNVGLKKKWLLIEFQKFTKSELTQKKAYMDLKRIEKGGTAKMGCNTIFFDVKPKKNKKIAFSGLGSTMMYCDGNMILEQEFSNFLPSVNQYQISGHFLILKNSKGETMKFIAEDWD